MEQLYYITGLIFIWILCFFGVLFISLWIIEKLIEILAKKVNALIKIIEYAYNRKEFNEYLKMKKNEKMQ
jgi:hypothetical protein